MQDGAVIGSKAIVIGVNFRPCGGVASRVAKNECSFQLNRATGLKNKRLHRVSVASVLHGYASVYLSICQ